MKLDMHFHSTKSDGTCSPEERIKQAKERWLGFIALTDHDIISRWFKSQASQVWMQSCESVEISARNYQHNKSLHLTMYANHIQDDIDAILHNITESKSILIKKQIDFLNSKWFQIDIDEFYCFACSWWRTIDNLHRFDIIVYIFATPYNKKHAIFINWDVDISYIDFYNKYMKRWWEEFDKYWVTIDEYEASLEIVRNIKEKNNAILSIPHPNFTFKWWISEFQNNLEHYINIWGVNALEINARATQEWVKAILEAKDTYWLYLTFGSDCHRIWIPDDKHWDFWEMNPYISEDFIKKSFNEYNNILI